MKLGKTSWVILSVGVFIVIVAGLGLTRSQQLKQQDSLDEQLGVAETRLNNLQVKQQLQEQADLQEQLDESKLELATAKDGLRQSAETVDVADKFYAIAYYSNVVVNSITLEEPSSDKLGGVNLATTNVNAAVTGTRADLINFIIKLNHDFTTGAVQSAQIAVAEGGEATGSTANIRLTVYSYEGS